MAQVDVVCIPDAEWDASLWTNRQQLMSRLAARNDVRVFYVAPPRFALSRWLRKDRLQRRVGEISSRRSLFTRRVGERLWVLQPLLPVPNGFARRWAPGALDGLLTWLIRRTTRKLRFTRPVLWSYTPLATAFQGRLNECLLCYDVVDDYPSQPNYQALGPEIAAQDESLTRAADLVLTTSKVLQRERSRLNPNCHLLGNAADVDLFSRARGSGPEPAELRDIAGPVLGFHGALSAHKLDLELLRSLAERRPDWHLVLIGPSTDGAVEAALGSFANVRLLGFRRPEELPAFLRHFDVCVIPYRRSPYTERLSALKVRECLAAGRPVVATALPGFQELSDLIALGYDSEHFEQEVELSLKCPPTALELDHTALANFSWEAKADRAWRLIEEALRMRRPAAERTQA